MILVDTSVWIDHFRKPDPQLVGLLGDDAVWAHPMVIGELAVGSFAKRKEILAMLQGLWQMEVAYDQEVLDFIEKFNLFGIGIGYIDAHLLASLRLTPRAEFWTRDKRLAAAAERLGFNVFKTNRLH